jgi:hypothetical protein
MRKVANDEVCREAMVGGLDDLEDRTGEKRGLGRGIEDDKRIIGGNGRMERSVRLGRQAR